MVSAQVKPQPASTDTYPAPLVLRLPGGWALTDDCIIQLGALNGELWFERTAEGALMISPPPGWESSQREFKIGLQIGSWDLDQEKRPSIRVNGRLPPTGFVAARP